MNRFWTELFVGTLTGQSHCEKVEGVSPTHPFFSLLKYASNNLLTLMKESTEHGWSCVAGAVS